MVDKGKTLSFIETSDCCSGEVIYKMPPKGITLMLSWCADSAIEYYAELPPQAPTFGFGLDAIAPLVTNLR